jgi:hypothetical protein
VLTVILPRGISKISENRIVMVALRKVCHIWLTLTW